MAERKFVDNKIDYHIMYPKGGKTTPNETRSVKSRKKIDHGFFKPVQEKRPERPLNTECREYRMKALLFVDPRLTVDEIMERLGLTESHQRHTVANIRSEYLHTIRFLISMGIKGLKI